MQNQFYNQPVVNWAKQNLPQPFEIKLLFGERWKMLLVYALLFSIPLLIIALMLLRMLTEKIEGGWLGFFLCSGILLLPCFVIVLVGMFTRQKFVKSLAADGVKSSMGKRFLWENLFYIDHVSKITRAGGVSRKIEDNQLELVFADGKAIIPPLIKDRERVWSLINSIPAQVKFDGEIKAVQPENAPVDISTEDFMRELARLAGQNNQDK
ncbi:MAG TPA: hypothetical protein VNB22_00710 [Pyrinomonadaceae bacterium]|nr:hypothetical protein [Pyrinomonadaceae bacterium]